MSKQKHRGGRPTKYNANYHPALVEHMAARGISDKKMAVELGVTESTFNNWKHAHPEFLECLKKGRDSVGDMVESALVKRCIGYEHESMHITSFQGDVKQTPIVKRYPPDTEAIKFYLKNRRPDRWKDSREITGDSDKPLEIRMVPISEIMEDDESSS